MIRYCTYFSPLEVKNKPCEGVTTTVFNCVPVGMVAYSSCFALSRKRPKMFFGYCLNTRPHICHTEEIIGVVRDDVPGGGLAAAPV